jgi:hypothetical protein
MEYAILNLRTQFDAPQAASGLINQFTGQRAKEELQSFKLYIIFDTKT